MLIGNNFHTNFRKNSFSNPGNPANKTLNFGCKGDEQSKQIEDTVEKYMKLFKITDKKLALKLVQIDVKHLEDSGISPELAVYIVKVNLMSYL